MNYIEQFWRDAKPADAIKEPELIEAAQGCVDDMFMHRVVHGEDGVYLRCLPSIKECEVMR